MVIVLQRSSNVALRMYDINESATSCSRGSRCDLARTLDWSRGQAFAAGLQHRLELLRDRVLSL